MKRKMILTLSLAILSMISTTVLATPSWVNPDANAGLGEMAGTVNGVLGVIKTVGYVVAIAMVMFAGIKYLMAGVGEKAKVKEMLFPMLAGAVLIAGAVTIVDWVWGVGGNSTQQPAAQQQQQQQGGATGAVVGGSTMVQNPTINPGDPVFPTHVDE